MMKNCNNYDKDKERDRILEEARKIEEELGPDLEFPETEEEVDAAYQRLLIRIQEEQEKEKECENLPSKSRKSRIHSSMVALGKCAAIVAVTLFGMFTLSMTSEANREWVMRRVNYLTGKGEIEISIGNDDSLDESDREEEEARDNIQKVLNVDVPILMYRPTGFKYEGYNVEKNSKIAKIFYDYNQEKITLFIYAGNEKQDVNIHIHGKVKGSYIVRKEDFDIECYCMDEDGQEKPAYVAMWEYNTNYYQLGGIIEEKEFVEILNNLYF